MFFDDWLVTGSAWVGHLVGFTQASYNHIQPEVRLLVAVRGAGTEGMRPRNGFRSLLAHPCTHAERCAFCSRHSEKSTFAAYMCVRRSPKTRRCRIFWSNAETTEVSCGGAVLVLCILGASPALSFGCAQVLYPKVSHLERFVTPAIGERAEATS